MKLSIDKIKPNPDNPRTIDDQALEKLVKSLKEFPEMTEAREIIVNKDYMILGGNMRFKAMQALGWAEIPVKIVDWPVEKQKEFIIKDNVSGGDWDWSVLADEWDSELLDEWGLDVPLIGVQLEEDDFDSEEEYKKIEKPKSVEGDVYAIGRHKILCGSSTEIDSFKKLLGAEKAQMIFTDPPYNVDYKSTAGNSYSGGKYGGGGKIFNDNKSVDEFINFLSDFLSNCYQFTDEQAVVYMWYASKNVDQFRQGFLNSGWKYQQDVIWVKERFVFGFGVNFHRAYEPCMIAVKNGKFRKNKEYANQQDVWSVSKEELADTMDVWFFNRDFTNQYVHPTQKPVALAEGLLIETSKRAIL